MLTPPFCAVKLLQGMELPTLLTESASNALQLYAGSPQVCWAYSVSNTVGLAVGQFGVAITNL